MRISNISKEKEVVHWIEAVNALIIHLKTEEVLENVKRWWFSFDLPELPPKN